MTVMLLLNEVTYGSFVHCVCTCVVMEVNERTQIARIKPKSLTFVIAVIYNMGDVIIARTQRSSCTWRIIPFPMMCINIGVGQLVGSWWKYGVIIVLLYFSSSMAESLRRRTHKSEGAPGQYALINTTFVIKVTPFQPVRRNH
jgi:hypothetical protein